MKIIFYLFIFFLAYNCPFSAPPLQYNLKSTNSLPNPEYTIVINGTGNQVDKIYPIYRVDSEHLIKNAIHIKTKHLINYDKTYFQLHSSSLSTILNKHKVNLIRMPFFDETSASPLSTKEIGIERIYEIYFADEIDPYEVCKELLQSPDIEYAVPIYKRYLYDFTPNDPSIGSQWYINNIQLPKAWDISKGDKKVVIAIIDSGVDWKHSDLKDNIWKNPKEIPDNKVDDDGNGKVDDVSGWDFVGNVTAADIQAGTFREDNDPINITGFHGTHVAGAASAVTNNGVGIASPGFSCSILPIKCSPDQGGMGIYRGYEAIVYAANLGAKVINCSWGGPGFSLAEQEIINYALNKGSLVVVASGNDGGLIDYGGQFPAGYDNVLCVGATNSSNAVANFSNWGMKVTVYAPGQRIYSTMPNNNYSNQDGTSMASPIVAGVAGLVASLHTDWSPRQILHQIRSTSDNVLTSDPAKRPYYYGKVNAYRALYFNHLSNPSIPGLQIFDVSFSRGNSLFDFNPNVLSLKIKNHLGPASNVTLKIKPLNNFISVDQTTFSLGNFATGGQKDITLTVTLLENNPWYLGNAYLQCSFEASNYTDYQVVSLPVRITSNNKLTKLFTFPDMYQPQWYGASSPQHDCVWAVGQGGLFGSLSGFLRVSSGSYRMNYISSSARVYCITALNSMVAYAGSGSQNQTSAYVFFTTNGGNNWSSINVSSITGFINAIYFFEQKEGIFLGDPKNGVWGVGRSTDGGTTWLPVVNLPPPNQNETALVNSTCRWNDHLWFGTNQGRIFFSTNRGQNWGFGTIPNAAIVLYITFRDNLNGMAVYTETTETTAPRYLATTSDGGKTWKPKQFNFTQYGLVPVYLFTPENSKFMYVLCSGGEIFGTSDLGDNWTPILNEFTGGIQTGAEIVLQNTLVRLWQLGLSVSYLDFGLVPQKIIKEVQLLSENLLKYDTVNIGSNKLRSVTIKNIGNSPVALKAKIDTTLGSTTEEFKFFGNLQDSIAPGEEVQIRVRFIPKQEGQRRAKLIIETDGNPQRIEIELQGFGRNIISTTEPESLEKFGLIISPNPVENFLTIYTHSSINKSVHIKIFDLLGNEVLSEKDIELSSYRIFLNVSNLRSGMYIVKISVENKILYGNFLKK
ncbi:MAG: S8 family serine peptidase [Ignavibacteria bacterium]|nr:S8 family serine peptidase [Ignavibacteria bacterium]